MTAREAIQCFANKVDPFGPDHLAPIDQGGRITVIPRISHGRVDWIRFRYAGTRYKVSVLEIEKGDMLHPFSPYKDALTGLLNRAGLDRVVISRFINEAIAAGPDKGLMVAFIDLDSFKPVNDKYGHDAGDQLLEQVALRLKLVTAQSGIAIRQGGDEFVVVFRPMSYEEACDFLLRLHKATNGDPYVLYLDDGSQEEVPASASVGGAWSPSDHVKVTAPEILRGADKAMYAYKKKRGQGLAAPSLVRLPMAPSCSSRNPA